MGQKISIKNKAIEEELIKSDQHIVVNKKRSAHKIELFPFDFTQSDAIELYNGLDENEKLFLQSVLSPYIKNLPDITNVEWDFNNIYAKLKQLVPESITHWYDNTTSSGDSTNHTIAAFSKYRMCPNYLLPDKTFYYPTTLKFHSKAMGSTTFTAPTPIFVAPYGAANLYGGHSDEMECAKGANNANVIYTIPELTKYSIEELYAASKMPKMFQLYLTADDDINISLIERAKQSGIFAIMVTIDAGAAHGGIPMIASGSDITFSHYISGNILSDTVFNIKCFAAIKCIGTKNSAVINMVAKSLNVPTEEVKKSYDLKKAFKFARSVQIRGMSKQNSTLDENAKEYIWSLKHIAEICHSATSISKYVEYKFNKGIPLIAKGILSVKDALSAIECDVDCLYVSNHGGRFLSNSVAPIDMLADIKKAAIAKSSNIGIWFDSGIRTASDILIAYCRGADYVGIGRPVIYSCVVYGQIGVEAILKQLLFFFKQQCILCGVNNMNNLEQLKNIII